MSKLKQFALPAILAAALVIIGCSSDDPAGPGDGTTDTTPPGISGVTALDQIHLDVLFSETVQEGGAQQPDNYLVIETTITKGAAAATPGDTIWVSSAVLDNDGKTVHLATQSPMGDVPYVLGVKGVKDVAGNVIQAGAESAFAGNQDPDTTAPTVAGHIPASGATGVGIGQTVTVQFSEPMDYSSVLAAFSWEKGGTPVAHEVQDDNGNFFIFSALSPLENNTLYTVTISGAAQDWAGNSLATTTWSFTTTGVVDTTPPVLVSSTPANNATNVAVGSNLVITLSEAVEQNSLDEVLISPDIGDGVAVWSNGWRTVTFDPFIDMMDDTNYYLVIPPGGLRDLAGNGNADLISIVWSTGSRLDSGRFSGTISGPGSAAAANPAGAIVIAADTDPFGDIEFGVAGSGTVNAAGAYAVENLPDGTYWPACFLNTNDDGQVDPSLGDAIGAYGVSFNPMSGDPTSIVIAEGGSLGNIDFAIYDPMAIAGSFSYEGTAFPGCCYQYYIGLFDTVGFQIANPGDPVFSTFGYNWPGENSWSVSELDNGLEAGTYYVGAYLDGNDNQQADPGEPLGFIGGLDPTPFTVADGSDRLGLSIVLNDAEAGITPWVNQPGSRTAGDGKDGLRRLVRAFKESRQN
jgi:hypothetical protein